MLKFLLTFFFSILSFSLAAGPALVMNITGGRAYMDLHGKDTTFYYPNIPPPVNTDLFLKPNNEDQDSAMFGVFAGIEWQTQRIGIWQPGIGYYQYSTTSVRGPIYDASLPIYYNSDYQFKIKHQRLMGETKWLTQLGKNFYPYLWAGAGVAFNEAYNYEQIPLIPEAVPVNLLSSHTTKSFTYGLGLGIDYSVLDWLRFGIGYRYMDAGKVELGKTPTGETQDVLSYNPFSGSEFLAQMTVLY